jgi:hypothetical protein
MRMQPQEPRDVDGVIDTVARAMTSARLARDLSPAIAARIAARPPWPVAWRVAMAGAVMAAVVLVAVVWWPGEPPAQVARSIASQSAVTVSLQQVPARPTTSEGAVTEIRTSRPPVRAVSRQTIVAATGASGDVDIRPLAIVPVEADPLVPLEAVEITPIDVEPVRIAGVGELVE